jgi:hypothetical protein
MADAMIVLLAIFVLIAPDAARAQLSAPAPPPPPPPPAPPGWETVRGRCGGQSAVHGDQSVADLERVIPRLHAVLRSGTAAEKTALLEEYFWFNCDISWDDDMVTKSWIGTRTRPTREAVVALLEEALGGAVDDRLRDICIELALDHDLASVAPAMVQKLIEALPTKNQCAYTRILLRVWPETGAWPGSTRSRARRARRASRARPT